MYAMSYEESWYRGGPGSGVGLCQECEPGSWPLKGVVQGGGFTRGPGTAPCMQLEAFPESPTSFPSSFVLHIVSLTPSLLQSLFLASCSPAPRTVAAHTLPGYRDKEAGVGGLERVALIWGAGWKSAHPSNSRLVSQRLCPPCPGFESQIGV